MPKSSKADSISVTTPSDHLALFYSLITIVFQTGLSISSAISVLLYVGSDVLLPSVMFYQHVADYDSPQIPFPFV